MKFEWELIFKSDDKVTETWRAKTFGGWLVKDFNCIYTDDDTTRRYSTCEALSFISDPEYKWNITK